MDEAKGAVSSATIAQWNVSFYFPDGDIILSCQKDGGATHFRVHKFIISHHSPVFAGMLTLPASSPENESFDGVPVVHLQDDAKDLESVLHALYNPTSGLSFPRLSPHTPMKAMGILRLAKKYQIDHLVNFIMKQVESDWPRSLREWRFFQEEAGKSRREFCEQKDQSGLVDGQYFEDLFPEPASTIRLAIDFDCPSILPAAFYALASVPTQKDWDEMRESPSDQWVKTLGRTARWALLDRGDLWRFGIGTFSLRNHVTLLSSSILEVTKDLCSEACRTKCRQTVK